MKCLRTSLNNIAATARNMGQIQNIMAETGCNNRFGSSDDWLDGFCVDKGVIRQFVAMPLGGGYTAEEQVTGKAEYGGLQILVHPMRRDVFERRFPERLEVVYARESEDHVCSSPRER